MRPSTTKRFFVLAITGAMALLTALAPADGASPTTGRALTRDEELYLLDARQAQLDLDQARTEMEKAKVELEETKTLFDEKLVTVDKLNQAKQKHERAILKHEQAKIELEKKRLEFLKDATRIALVDAKKFRNEDGEIIASVTLRNDSDINKARIAMEGGEQLSDKRLTSLLKVRNVIVTLRGEAEIKTGSGPGERRFSSGKAIVGDPFRRIVPELSYGKEVVLEYRLLKKDIENITVSVEVLGTQKDYDVFLKKESQQDMPVISSTQYSQIGQLGTKILYDIELERLAKTEQSFALVVLNLPPEIPVAFLDPTSKAMLTQVKFTEELSRLSLYFEVSLPEKLNQKWIDASMSFYVMVTRQSELKAIFEVRKKHGGNIPPEEVAKLKGEKVELILIPRGVGKLEILVPNLYKAIEQGDPLTIKFNVMNSGTLALRRVAPELDLPIEWEAELVPSEAVAVPGVTVGAGAAVSL